VCRADFTDKAEFMFHIRTHFDAHAQQAAAPQPSSGKQGGSDAATAELIARGSFVDPSGLCS